LIRLDQAHTLEMSTGHDTSSGDDFRVARSWRDGLGPAPARGWTLTGPGRLERKEVIACVVITRGGWPNGGRRVARRASRIFEPIKVWFGRAGSEGFQSGRIRLSLLTDDPRGSSRGLRLVRDLLLGLLSGLVGLGVYQVHFRSPGGVRRFGVTPPLDIQAYTKKAPATCRKQASGPFCFCSSLVRVFRSIKPNFPNP